MVLSLIWISVSVEVAFHSHTQVFGLGKFPLSKYLGAICFRQTSEGNQYKLIGIRIKEMDLCGLLGYTLDMYRLHLYSELNLEKDGAACSQNRNVAAAGCDKNVVMDLKRSQMSHCLRQSHELAIRLMA